MNRRGAFHFSAPARVAWLLAAALLLAFGAVRAAVVVDFEVDMAGEIAAGRFAPERDQVGLRGGQAPLSWGQPLLMRPLGGGRYGLSVSFADPPRGAQPLQHKFRIERAGAGNDQGWEPGRNHTLALDAVAPRVVRRFGAEAAPGPRRISGTVESLGVVASAHVTPRAVQVWLPPGYAGAPQRRYPVLYLHEGQNVFDAAAAGAEWQVDETAQRLVSAGTVEPMIIVAVDSGPHRTTDYTPTAGVIEASGSWLKPPVRAGGGAPAYARFLVSELKPLVDARYRTRPEPAATAVGGSSLGGLVSLWLLLHHPQTFGAALVVSPSLWWDDRFAARDLASVALPARGRPRVWRRDWRGVTF